MQPVTLYMTVNIASPTLYNSPSNIRTEEVVSPTEAAALPGRIQSLNPFHGFIGLMDTRMRIPGTSKRDRSDTCERAIRRIKWVMDTLSPIAEVRVISF